MPDSTSEDEIWDFSSITSYNLEKYSKSIRKLSRSPSLVSSYNASIDEEKQEQSSRIGNTSWCQCGKCYAVETERESLLSRCKWQKQPSIDVLRKMCCEKMQQIYRRTPMPKCDFNKVAKQPPATPFQKLRSCHALPPFWNVGWRLNPLLQ